MTTIPQIDFYKFFFLTPADVAISGAPKDYLQNITLENYRGLIDTAIKRAKDTFDTGAIKKPTWVGGNKNHAQEFFEDDTSKDIPESCKIYLDYLLANCHFPIQTKNPPGPKWKHGAQRAIFENPNPEPLNQP